MGAGGTRVTKILDQIKTSAAAATGFDADRVFQGKKVHEETDDHEEAVRGQAAETVGYFTFFPTVRTGGGKGKVGTLTVEGTVEAHLPQETTTDANSLLDMVEGLFKALTRSDTFEALDLPVVVLEGSNWVAPDEFSGSLKDAIVEFQMTLVYQLGVNCE